MAENKRKAQTEEAVQETAQAEEKQDQLPTTPSGEELVDFTAPYDPTGESREIILGVNGETIRVKRGETVQIKRKFVEVWENSQAQTLSALKARQEAQASAQKAVAEL